MKCLSPILATVEVGEFFSVFDKCMAWKNIFLVCLVWGQTPFYTRIPLRKKIKLSFLFLEKVFLFENSDLGKRKVCASLQNYQKFKFEIKTEINLSDTRKDLFFPINRVFWPKYNLKTNNTPKKNPKLKHHLTPSNNGRLERLH